MARKMGLAVVVMGDVIREEAARRGLEPTDQNLGAIGIELRSLEGPTVVARRTMEKVEKLRESNVVVDGLRSREEADFFQANAEEFYLVEICAPKESRIEWLEDRGRADDPGSRNQSRWKPKAPY